MQNKIQIENQKKSAIARQLNPENDPNKTVWLISIENEEYEMPAGLMVEAKVGIGAQGGNVGAAAEAIAKKTHRVATPAEVERFLVEEAARREDLIKAEQARKLAMNVKIQQDPELLQILVAMAQKLTEEKSEQKKGK